MSVMTTPSMTTRRRVTGLVVVAIIMVSAGPASGEVGVNGGGDTIDIDGSSGGAEPGGPGEAGGGSGGGGPRPPVTYIVVPEILVDPMTGEPCLNLVNRPGDPNSAQALANEVRAIELSSSYPPCAGSNAVPSAPSPGAVAAMLWRDRMQLPPPQPRIQPGWAIAGKDAFVELGGASSVTRHFNAFGYDLTITATATTNDIGWGDSFRTDGTRSNGGPWPDGDLTHVWTSAGTYDVVITRHWTGVWSLTGQAAQPVPGQLHTTATLDDFEVRGYQAVRNR